MTVLRIAGLLLLCALAARPVSAAASARLYLFYARGCSSCAAEEDFLEGLQRRWPTLEIRRFEVLHEPDNARFMVLAGRRFGVEIEAVPATFVGADAPILGFRDERTTGSQIEERVRECLERGCADPVAALLGEGTPPAADAALPRRSAPAATAPAAPGPVELPLLGKTDLARLPLVALAVVLGGFDSFNPCAFFVLLSLLGIIVHAHSRGRILLVGGTFVLFSGLIYFLFMAAWLNLFLHLGALRMVTIAAGGVALVIAAINIKDYFCFHQGVSLSIPESSKPGLFRRMRALVSAGSVPATLAGTAVLAIAANSYELLCTSGFPMVFTRILTLNRLSPLEHYRYLALYNAVYVVPLALVVVLCAHSLGAHKLSESQGRVMKLVSGLMMLGLGIVVLVDPALFGNLLAGVVLLGASVLIAAVIVLLDRHHGRCAMKKATTVLLLLLTCSAALPLAVIAQERASPLPMTRFVEMFTDPLATSAQKEVGLPEGAWYEGQITVTDVEYFGAKGSDPAYADIKDWNYSGGCYLLVFRTTDTAGALKLKVGEKIVIRGKMMNFGLNITKYTAGCETRFALFRECELVGPAPAAR